MIEVKFYESVEDDLLKFAVIVSRAGGKWVFCKHGKRTTLEVPGGHREPGESIEETARRELWEETGALKYSLRPICVYSVVREGEESFGMLYGADICAFASELHSEIEKIYLLDAPPEHWTYPEIQPLLLKEALRREVFL